MGHLSNLVKTTLNKANGTFQNSTMTNLKNSTRSTSKIDAYCQKQQLLPTTAIFISAESAIY